MDSRIGLLTAAEVTGWYVLDAVNRTADLQGVPASRHNGSTNAAHLDGHVASYQVSYATPHTGSEIGDRTSNPRGWLWDYDK